METMQRPVTVTAIQCPDCGDLIYSRAHHDFHGCSCWDTKEDHSTGVAVDGGFEYLRVCGGWDGKAHRIKIDATKRELYDDWNRGKDKFGTIPKKKAKVFLDAADEKNVRVDQSDNKP